MFKKYFSQAVFFALVFLAVPLHAVQYLEKGQGKNDREETSSNQNSSVASNSTPKENENSVKPVDLEKEKGYLEKALKISVRHYGSTDPNTAKVMEKLGNVLMKLDMYVVAKNYLEKALKIHAQHYGTAHPNTGRTIKNLGIVLIKQGAYREAKKYLEKALKIEEEHYGAIHTKTMLLPISLNLFWENSNPNAIICIFWA